MGNIVGVEKSKAAAPPPAGDKEEDLGAIQEKSCRTRFEQQKTLALSDDDADDTICRFTGTTVPRIIKQDRDEATYVERNLLLLDELHAKRNAQAQMMMTAAILSGTPASSFTGYSNQADVVSSMTQELYCRQVGGVNCCLASLLSPRSDQDSMDLNTFLVDLAVGDSVALTTGSGGPGMAGKKSSRSGVGLAAEQMLPLPRMKGEVVEAQVHDEYTLVEGRGPVDKKEE